MFYVSYKKRDSFVAQYCVKSGFTRFGFN